MRVYQGDNNFAVCAIAGTRAILIAINCDKANLAGLKGFGFQRGVKGNPLEWLQGLKTFKQLTPNPQNGAQYSTQQNPIQSFLWSDYTAHPDTEYHFSISALYGAPAHLQPRSTIDFVIRTEKEIDKAHGVWFNRGAIASQAFAREFGNKSLTEAEYNDPTNPETAWLSRGLVEACLKFINDTPKGDGLRVCAYEFTYAPVLQALKAAITRGVDVQIIFHDTPVNNKAVSAAGLADGHGKKSNLIKRTRPKIPHNKFIVRLEGGRKPIQVWTGSTNFTPSGFFGQTNVGHLVVDGSTAQTYLDFWLKLSANPLPAQALANAMALTPNPRNLVIPHPPTAVFSPRLSDKMLDWYGQRIQDAATNTMFTGAFGVAPKILSSIAKNGKSIRFVLLEKPPTKDIRDATRQNQGNLLVAYGAILGKMEGRNADGKPTKKYVPIPQFKLDEWFLKEELERRSGDGFVFFIHTKFLLVDPLSDDPLVCTGSANFSSGSLTSNDENMLLIRGDTRVADIYLTEFDRIFRHFYFRDVANDFAKKGKNADIVFLDETDDWSSPYFKVGNVKNHRREMFFADRKSNWAAQATKDPDVFSAEKAKKARAKKDTGTNKKATRKSKSKKLASKGKARKTSTKKTTRKPTKRKSSRKATTKKLTSKRRGVTKPTKGKRARTKATKKTTKKTTKRKPATPKRQSRKR